MARHRTPSWWMRNRASIPARGLALVALTNVLLALTGTTPAGAAPASEQHVSVAASSVDTRPLDAFETHHFSVAPVIAVQLQTTAQQTSEPTSVTIESGSYLSKKAAELGSPWTWQRLCALTNPALPDCNKVPAGTVIPLTGPTHQLPGPISPATQVDVTTTAQVTHVTAPAPAPAVQVQHSVPAPAPAAQPTHVKVFPQPVVNPTPTAAFACNATPLHKQWMAAAGIAPSNCFFVDFIINHESSWVVTAHNPKPGSTAYGLPQATQGKMASMGADWRTNPVTQLKWANWYAQHGNYSSWAQAYAHWTANRWW